MGIIRTSLWAWVSVAVIACGGHETSHEPETNAAPPADEAQGGVLVRNEGGAKKPDERGVTSVVPGRRIQKGRVVLEFPDGAVGDAAILDAITVKLLPNSVLPPGGVQGTAFDFGPDGTAFDRPVRVTIRFDIRYATSEWLRIVQLLPEGGIAPVQFGAINLKEGYVQAYLRHFSQYAVLDMSNAIKREQHKPATDVDVLFVVDNSGSMIEEQTGLSANFMGFVSQLTSSGLNYRIGVTSTSVGAAASCAPFAGPNKSGGELLHTPMQSKDCPVPTDPWIQSTGSSTNVPNNDVNAAFSCIASLGTNGCGYEMPLEAMRRAILPATNPDFIRKDAALAVVLITDEDDCTPKDMTTQSTGVYACFDQSVTCDEKPSADGTYACKVRDDGPLQPVNQFVDALNALKPDGNLVVATVAGGAGRVKAAASTTPSAGVLSPAPFCASARGSAYPSFRMDQFVTSFGDSGKSENICDDDYSTVLSNLGKLVATNVQVDWCIPFKPQDSVPETPGLDADCSLTTHKDDPTKSETLHLCNGSKDTRCFDLLPSMTCPAGPALRVHLRNTDPASLGAQVALECLVDGS